MLLPSQSKSTSKAELDFFFEPSSVAIVGASSKRNALGTLILQNLRQQGYQGRIYPVNPKARRVQGLKCYPDLFSLPSSPELTIIAIPAKYVPGQLEACAKLGARHAIVVSAGFKESGPEGRKLEQELVEISNNNGIRILGPNCLGVFDNVSCLDTFFLPRHFIRRPKIGPISVVSQSGSFVGHLMDLAAFEDIGIARVLTYGNEADISVVDALRYLANDDATRVVGLYVEAVKQGGDFAKAASYCSARKPVVVLKTGRSDATLSAVTSHTGAISSEYSAYKSAFRKAGLIQVNSEIDFADACKVLSMAPMSSGAHVLIIGHAGGLGLTLADLCLENGLAVPEVLPEIQKRLRNLTLPIASVRNPIDLTASGTDDQMEAVLEEVFVKQPHFDIAIYLGVWGLLQTSDRIANILSREMKNAGKPILVASIQGKRCLLKKSLFENRGVPVLLSMERAARAAKVLCSNLSKAQRGQMKVSDRRSRKRNLQLRLRRGHARRMF